MSKKTKRKDFEKTKERRQLWQLLFAGVLVFSAVAFAFFGDFDSENTDLSLIGKGENVVVQVHAPN